MTSPGGRIGAASAPMTGIARGKRVYDVAIFGKDVGGAVAGALLAKKGLRVLLATLGPMAATRESEGWLLPTAQPVLAPLRQLSGTAGPLDELGVGQELQRQAAATGGAFQILSDRLRLSLPGDPVRRRVELRRELGETAAAQAETDLDELERLGRPWDAFIVEAPPLPARGFFERRRLEKTLPVPPPLPEGVVGEALAALSPFAANLVGDSAPEATAREAAALLRSPLRLWGGAAQLGELLRKKAVESGAEVTPERCRNLRVDRKGVSFDVGEAEIRASAAIFACDGASVAELCAGGGRTERKLAEEADLPIARQVVLSHFVVRGEGLPLALEEAALLLGHPSGPMVISAVPARRARGEAAGEKLLTIGRVADTASLPSGDELLASVRAALEPVLPFFDRHVVHQAVDVAPLQSHALLRPDEDAEPIGLRPDSDVHDRVLFASDAVYPGFGLEGSILGARAAVEKSLALSGRKQVAAT